MQGVHKANLSRLLSKESIIEDRKATGLITFKENEVNLSIHELIE
jgi:hypothetical protein